jgi:hypothetical protein
MTDHLADQQRTAALALQRAELTMEQLWLRYFALGGDAGLIDIDAYIHGLGGLPPLQRDILAHAVNERLDELRWTHRASYTRPVPDNQMRSRPLAALVELLEGTELIPPDRLAAVAEAAGRTLGVTITIYLVDYDQCQLHPIPAGGGIGHARQPLDVDGTLAGRAFRQLEILPAHTTGRPRLWVPLLDSAERIGVLEVEVAAESNLDDDDGLRSRCRWMSMLLGHLVTLLTQYGDGLERQRIRTPRTVNGELIWSLLPPLTAGVDDFIVSGVVEPRQNVIGDAFDYALSETGAALIILDAAGHDVRSGLITAAAVAAYRSARHAGHGLDEQARLIDETIKRQFGATAFATAVLAEVDLVTGRLRYLNAGHRDPLVMRSGKVVKPLTAGRNRALGQGLGEFTIAEEALQPEDWLVLYTDGITEARDHGGEQFGEDRLAAFLKHEAAAGHPLPETARRLVQAVLAHQNGALQDDASVLLARRTNADQLRP